MVSQNCSISRKRPPLHCNKLAVTNGSIRVACQYPFTKDETSFDKDKSNFYHVPQNLHDFENQPLGRKGKRQNNDIQEDWKRNHYVPNSMLLRKMNDKGGDVFEEDIHEDNLFMRNKYTIPTKDHEAFMSMIQSSKWQTVFLNAYFLSNQLKLYIEYILFGQFQANAKNCSNHVNKKHQFNFCKKHKCMLDTNSEGHWKCPSIIEIQDILYKLHTFPRNDEFWLLYRENFPQIILPNNMDYINNHNRWKTHTSRKDEDCIYKESPLVNVDDENDEHDYNDIDNDTFNDTSDKEFFNLKQFPSTIIENMNESRCSPALIDLILFIRNTIAQIVLKCWIPEICDREMSTSTIISHKSQSDFRVIFPSQSVTKVGEFPKSLDDLRRRITVIIKSFTKFQSGLSQLSRVFNYLNDQYSVFETSFSSNSISIYSLGLIIWRDIVLCGANSKLLYGDQFPNCYTSAAANGIINDLIESVQAYCRKERLHGTSNPQISHLIRIFLKYVQDIGNSLESPNMYKILFEETYLRNLECDIITLEEDIHRSSINSWMLKVRWIICSAKRYFSLDHPTNKRVFDLLHSRLVCCENFHFMFENFDKWIYDSQGFENLHNLMTIVENNDLALQFMESRLCHIIGDDLSQIHQSIQNCEDCSMMKILRMFLNRYSFFSSLISGPLKNHFQFVKAREHTFSSILNFSNEISEKVCHQLIANVTEIMSEQNTLDENKDNTETCLDIVTIYSLLENTDYFFSLYSIQLAKRLLSQCYSIQNEKEFLLQLQRIPKNSSKHINRLLRMINDIQTASHLDEEIRRELSSMMNCSFVQKQAPVLSSMILTHCAWPQFDTQSLYVPHATLTFFHEVIENIYSSQHVGRKLSWIHRLEKGILKTYGFDRTYYLHATSIQASILLQLNDENEFSIQSLQEIYNISLMEIIQALKVVFDINLLQRFEQNGADTAKSQPMIKVNDSFKSNRSRIAIFRSGPSTATQKERTHVKESISRDRDYTIQALIVRLLKSRKQMSTSLIIQYVNDYMKEMQLSTTTKTIKRNLSALCEKEYIQYNLDIEGQHGYEYSC